MKCIVPLAGPDLISPGYGIKPLYPVRGRPLLEAALTSRPWLISGEVRASDIVFVLRNVPEAREVSALIDRIFPGAATVSLSSGTRGALLSALAGTALIHDFRTPLAIDLVDILYETNLSPSARFSAAPDLGALVPCFPGSSEKFSYLVRIDDEVLQAVEKRVVSTSASAGTYLFRDVATFLEATADSLRFDALYSVRDSMFVCPALNGVKRLGLRVAAVDVDRVVDLSTVLKEQT